MRRFRVDDLAAPRLEPGAAHHLLHVLRHPVGGALVLFDGRGQEVEATLASGEGEVRVTGEPRRRAPGHALHLVLALPKGPALEHALRMGVEAGVTHVHPVLTARTIPKGDHGDRWAKVLESAAQQCGRADVPWLAPVHPLRTSVEALPAGLDLRVALPDAERGRRATGPAAVVIGPEGGLAPAEVAWLVSRGFVALGLGPWVLRTDTAVAVAAATLATE